MSDTYKDDKFFYEDEGEGKAFLDREPHQDVEFLNDLDKGYIGLEPPQIVKTFISPQESYYLSRRIRAAHEFGIKLEDIADEPDNDPASGEDDLWAMGEKI